MFIGSFQRLEKKIKVPRYVLDEHGAAGTNKQLTRSSLPKRSRYYKWGPFRDTE